MRKVTIRTSLDIPMDLHRRLRETAARQGRSARQLILEYIEHAVHKGEVRRARHRFEPDPDGECGDGPAVSSYE